MWELTNTEWVALAFALFGSFAACGLIVLTQGWHGALSLDHDLDSVQKLHLRPVPRVGGIGLLIGLMVASLAAYGLDNPAAPLALGLLACSAPVFAAGLIEDITKVVNVQTRLFSAALSATLAWWLLDAKLIHLHTPYLDDLIRYSWVSAVFTVFAVSGMTNAVNLIDGLNGLAAGTVALMLAGLGALAWIHGDQLVMQLCLWGMVASVGFLLVNYPFGKIFMGDGGAYLAGFWVAECGILLLSRNPDISTWTVLLCCIYPVWETVYSIYRRQFIDKVNSGHPDMTHLHHLVYRGLHTSTSIRFGAEWIKHGLVSASIWTMVALCQLIATTARHNTALLAVGVGSFAVIYYWIYQTMAAIDLEEEDVDVAVQAH
jgi:UDP-N-acetylmuramyl pentapeptide phosphotransferase/UDP-N-acetylglucosamine-1-phosphate transferase